MIISYIILQVTFNPLDAEATVVKSMKQLNCLKTIFMSW